MGLEMSKPECSLNSRYFIGHEKSAEILTSCAIHKSYWFLGFTVVLTLGLFVLFLSTRQYDGVTGLKVPLFIVFMPAALYIFYCITIRSNSLRLFQRESLEQKLSGMEKKEYLAYKGNDDRAKLGFLGSATSASILATSNVLGPYFRGDRPLG